MHNGEKGEGPILKIPNTDVIFFLKNRSSFRLNLSSQNRTRGIEKAALR